MGRKTELQTEDVFAAISAVVAGGKAPTTVRVRAQLGDRGSPIVLQRFIDDWYDQVGRNLQVEGAGSTSTSAPQPPSMAGLQDELRRLTEATMRDLERAQAERVAVLDTRAAGLDARETDLLAREQRQDQREGDQAELVSRLRDAATTADARCRDAEVAASEQRQLATQAAAEAADAREARARAEAELEATRRQLTALSEREQALVAEVRRLAAVDVEARRVRDEASYLRKQLADVLAQLAQANGWLEAARGDRDEAELHLIETRESLAEARQKLAAADAAQTGLQGRITVLEGDLAAARDSAQRSTLAIAEAERQRAGAEGRLAALEPHQAEQQRNLASLHDRISELVGLLTHAPAPAPGTTQGGRR